MKKKHEQANCLDEEKRELEERVAALELYLRALGALTP